jgi:predicted DNA-binding transcriptional regulator YafY
MVICARNLEVLASRLFRFGSGAEIISPQEAREAAASLLRRMVVSEKGGKRRC